VVQHVIFNKDFSHSVMFTLDLIDKYLATLCLDNTSSEARTLQNQFGRLKSLIQYTDYYNLTNQQIEEVLNDTQTQLIQFSADFSKVFFSYS